MNDLNDNLLKTELEAILKRRTLLLASIKAKIAEVYFDSSYPALDDFFESIMDAIEDEFGSWN